ncbi:MAG: ribonuclease P protein component [Flavobacteriales bacterium]|nr:ribonuclease P protein component [Flavobacteriales bacterium]
MQFNNRFPKQEKLKSVKDIGFLFESGKSFNAFPLRVVYAKKTTKTGILANVGVSVPKKNIKLAVNRNLIKRRIKEAYRINNHELKNGIKNADVELNIMLVYTAKEICTYNQIEEKIKVILNRLNTWCEKGCE